MKKILKTTVGVLLFLSLQKVASAQNCNCLNVENFGVVINGSGDNTVAFQKAIDSATITGACLQARAGIIRTNNTLNLKAGVAIYGAGKGATNLTSPTTGTIIWFTGDSSAFTVTGANTALNNLSIYNANGTSKYGLLILANNNLIESTIGNNLLFYGFTSGTALKMYAKNAGGISYSSFYDIRIRHAKRGIEIGVGDSTSFVNSNSFYHGSISGGGYDYCVLINSGNNNVFYSTVIEPYTSTYGHLVVNSGQVIGENIRIEASQQPATTPVIKFASTSASSVLTGLFGGGLILNQGNNQINLTAANAMGENNPGYNMFANAGFLLPNSSNVPEFWQVSNSTVNVTTTTETVIQNEKVICLKVPPGVTCDFSPQTTFQPTLTSYPTNSLANISVLAKTTLSARVKVTYNYAGGLVSSVAHTGSGNWESIGLQAITNIANNPAPKININNSGRSDTLVVYLTSPTFNLGINVPQRSAAVITGAGGIVSGTLTNGLCSTFSFTSGTNYLVLPKTGNIFSITGTGQTITRINYSGSDKFPVGTVITLLFSASGNAVSNSAYIGLKSSFSSSGANTSLTIISMGDGTWKELGRNN